MENKEEKNQLKENILKEKPKMRQIIIEFDAQSIGFVKTEVSSNWELEAVLKNVLKKVVKQD